ncbi:MAG: hypothetical protein AAGA18_07730 [Verrucomicrobiota bacterium]
MKKTTLLITVVTLSAAFSTLALAQAIPPVWWSNGTPPMVEASGADNSAAAIQGQLKHITIRAYEELEANLPNGAGSSIESLIYGGSAGAGWYEEDAITPKVDPNANQLVVLGELKYIANLFFQRLVNQGYNIAFADGQTPQQWLLSWANETDPLNDPVNKQVVNLGQIKYLFSWDLAGDGGAGGEAGGPDGLPDWWEMLYFGDLGQGPLDNPDGDLLNNLEEFKLLRNPNADAINDTGGILGLTITTP